MSPVESSSARSPNSSGSNRSDGTVRLAQRVIGSAAFATLGLTVGFRGVAWSSIRSTFHLPLDAVGLWLLAATVGSIVSSYNGGYVGSLVGTGPFLAVSTAAVALGLLIYSRTPTNP